MICSERFQLLGVDGGDSRAERKSSVGNLFLNFSSIDTAYYG